MAKLRRVIISNARKDVTQLDLSYTTEWNISCYSHFGKQVHCLYTEGMYIQPHGNYSINLEKCIQMCSKEHVWEFVKSPNWKWKRSKCSSTVEWVNELPRCPHNINVKKQKKQLLPMTRRKISPTCWLKDTRHRITCMKWFHLYKVQKVSKTSPWFPI